MRRLVFFDCLGLIIACTLTPDGILMHPPAEPILGGIVAAFCGGGIVLAAQTKCVLLLMPDSANQTRRHAGECEGSRKDRRDGPLLYARFRRLRSPISAARVPPFRYDVNNNTIRLLKHLPPRGIVWAAMDADRLVFGDEWNVLSAPHADNVSALAVGPVGSAMLIFTLDAQGGGTVWRAGRARLEKRLVIGPEHALVSCRWDAFRLLAADAAQENVFAIDDVAGAAPLPRQCPACPPPLVPSAAGKCTAPGAACAAGTAGEGCRPCPPHTIAPFDGAATCAACPPSLPFSDDGIRCIPRMDAPRDAPEIAATNPPRELTYTLARPDGCTPTSVVASPVNGTLWLACDGNDLLILRPPTPIVWRETSARIRSVFSHASHAMVLALGAGSVYAYAGGDELVRIQNERIVQRLSAPMHIGALVLLAATTDDEPVWNAEPAVLVDATGRRFAMQSEIVALAPHPDGGILVLLRLHGVWRLWPRDGMVPLVVVPPSPASSIACCWDDGSLVTTAVMARSPSPNVAMQPLIRIDATRHVLPYIDDDQTVRAVYFLGDECSVDTIRDGTTLQCVPCPENTHAAPGALACAPCPPGEYLENRCLPCPTRWLAPRGCRPMQDTLPELDSAANRLFTLADALAAAGRSSELFCDFPAIILPLTRLSQADLLGRFWRLAPAESDTPAASPGIWLRCAEQNRTHGVCEYRPPDRSITPQWNQTFVRCAGRTQPEPLTERIVVPLDLFPCWVGWPAIAKPKSTTFSCPPGFFLHFLPPGAVQPQVCVRCSTATFSPGGQTLACAPRTVLACPPSKHYMIRNSDASAEHRCEPCPRCAADEEPLLLIAPSSRVSPTTDEITEDEGDERNLCTAATEDQPPYVCARTLNALPGFRLVLIPLLRLELHYEPCAARPPAWAVWVEGPHASACYFRCERRAVLRHIAPYAAAMRLLMRGAPFLIEPPRFVQYLPRSEQPNPDAFDAIADAVCAECDPCPDGTVRRLLGCDDECAPLCPHAPPHAEILTADCLWRCADAFFRLNDTFCAPCRPSSCAAGEDFDASRCQPEAAYADVCPPCDPRLPLLWSNTKPGVCAFNCTGRYYNSPDLNRCLPCETVTCPPGKHYVCAAEPCVPCPAPYNTLDGAAVLAPSSDAVCRVQCRPGYRALAADDDTPLFNDQLDPAQARCEPCERRPHLPCPRQCPDRLTLAPDGTCVPCLAACPPGTFPPPCTPGMPQSPVCLACPAHRREANRFFLHHCDTACIPGTVERDGECLPCALLFPPPPRGAPFVSYSYALPNASPGARWWPPEFDPPHLPLRSIVDPLHERRAGVCWPCPIGTPLPHSPAETEPCGAAAANHHPAAASHSHHPNALTHSHHPNAPSRRRRLFAEWPPIIGACPPGKRFFINACLPCKPNHFCLGGEEYPCPLFSNEPQCPDSLPPSLPCPPNYTLVDPPRNVCEQNAPPPLPVAPCSAECDASTLLDCACACPPATEWRDGRCAPCPNGTVSRSVGRAPCVAEPPKNVLLSFGK